MGGENCVRKLIWEKTTNTKLSITETFPVESGQLWEIGSANTAQGITACDELDHFGLVESWLLKLSVRVMMSF